MTCKYKFSGEKAVSDNVVPPVPPVVSRRVSVLGRRSVACPGLVPGPTVPRGLGAEEGPDGSGPSSGVHGGCKQGPP